MPGRILVIVQFPDAYQFSEGIFVVNEFLFDGLLGAIGNKDRKLVRSTDVSYEDALALAAAVDQLPRTPQIKLGWALCGDPGGGVDALVDFLRGGSFEIIDGEAVGPDDLG